jgi:hypothetical protein
MRWLNFEYLVAHWKTSATNRWGVEMEKSDGRGNYKHRFLDGKLNPTPWVDGPHPIAQGLRDSGHVATAGFSANKDAIGA